MTWRGAQARRSRRGAGRAVWSGAHSLPQRGKATRAPCTHTEGLRGITPRLEADR